MVLKKPYYNQTFYRMFKGVLEPVYAKWWNNQWKKSTVFYKGRGILPIRPRSLLSVSNYPFIVDDVLFKKLENISSFEFDDDKAFAVWKIVYKEIKYKSDKEVWDRLEYWQTPAETWSKKTGDCFAGYERIYTEDGVKRIDEIKVGDVVLSYDLVKKEFVYKKVTDFWSKGELQVNRVHLRNSQWFDVSENHPLWVRTNQSGISNYEKKYLSEVDLTRWWKRKIPIAKKIPYKVVDVEWLNEGLCKVLGHFLAEGSVDGSHVCSSGYDLVQEIIPILEENNIPFTEYKNNSGVPCIRFLKGDFKDFLKRQLNNSFDIHLEEGIFALPENKLRAIIEGYFIGDGHYSNYPQKKGYNSNKEYVLSTSSERLARDLQRMGLQVGFSFHIWKQEHHGGVGKMPIYRVTYNKESYFLQDYGYGGLSEVSISFVEKLDFVEMFDLTVEGTHTVVLENGVVSHQCEDFTLLFLKLCELVNVPAFRVKGCAGDVVWKGKIEGHCYPIYLREFDNDWCCMDLTFYPEYVDTKKRDLHKEMGDYKNIWWTFNREFEWAQHDVVIDWSKKVER